MDNLFGYSLKHLQEKMVSMGEKPYRATQLYQWIYERKVFDFDAMSDISKKFRDVLKADFCLTLPKKSLLNNIRIKYAFQNFCQ